MFGMKKYISILKTKIPFIFCYFSLGISLSIFYSHIYNRNREDKSKTTILIYGGFFGIDLLPELSQKCNLTENIKIVRSNNYVNHDVVILHFIQYNNFMKEAKYLIFKKKKIMILYFMVFFYLTRNLLGF